MSQEDQALMQQFEQLYASGDKAALADFLDEQNISDVAGLISEYPDYEIEIISLLSMHRATSTFKILDLSSQKNIIKSLDPQRLAELLNELPADDRTSFLEELPGTVVKELIKLLEPEERKVTLSLLGYEEGSVGRLMTPDYIAVYQSWTVEDVLAYIRRYGMNSETLDVIYVVDSLGKLIDDVRIREFLLASPETLVSELIDGRFIALQANDKQEVAIEIFKMNNRVALPVVDERNFLLGIVTIDDVLWVVNEEFSEDMQKMGGTEALDEPYLDISIIKLWQKRAGWLVVLFFGELLTATAMQYFEGEIEKAVVLSLFIPLIMSSGGNSGSQASTIIIQAMALGEVSIEDWWRVMRREIISGFMLGLALGILGFLRIYLWQTLHIYNYGEHWALIGMAISSSLVGIVLWGSLMGSMLPLILKRLKLDPATSSAPFVATLVDVTGIIIYFSFAYLFLKDILL